MNKSLISEYLAKLSYKNIVLAEYLKDDLEDTKNFISTCSKKELIKVYAVFENVVLHFMDKSLVDIFNKRKKHFRFKTKEYLFDLHNYSIRYAEDFLLIKSIVDEIDPLKLIKKNAPFTCYNKKIHELNFDIKRYTLDNITCKVQEVFKKADQSIIQELSERITRAFKDGSIKKYILCKDEDIYFTSYFDDKVEILKVNILTKESDYFISDDIFLYDGVYNIEISSYLLKLLCNELSSTFFDLSNYKFDEYSESYFEKIRTYKNGKEHVLLIDSQRKRYIYDINDITYFDYMKEKNQFIFDAMHNAIKKMGFKELIINQAFLEKTSMIDCELIKKVCELTCSKKDVVRNKKAIKYDREYPFKKYYNVEAIIGALNKYLSHEWDDITLSHWACTYNWILNGGFYRNLKENLDSFEAFIKEVISWDLDGLAFFSDSLYKNVAQEIFEQIEKYRNYDYVWQTRENWKAVYAMVGPYAEENEEQYVVLFNDKTKEYIIIFSSFLNNGFEDEFFKYVSEDELIDLVEQLKGKQYKLLKCSEKYFYDEISQ